MTAADLSESQVRELMACARAAVRRWRDERPWERDDLTGEAYLGLWEAVSPLPAGLPWETVRRHVATRAKQAVVHYLRSRRTGRITSRWHHQHGGSDVPVLSLLEEAAHDGGPTNDGGIDAAFDRVLGAQLWKWLLASATERERRAVAARCGRGLAGRAWADAIGCGPQSTTTYLQRGLDRVRPLVDAPLWRER